jgi:hypothetical protein
MILAQRQREELDSAAHLRLEHRAADKRRQQRHTGVVQLLGAVVPDGIVLTPPPPPPTHTRCSCCCQWWTSAGSTAAYGPTKSHDAGGDGSFPGGRGTRARGRGGCQHWCELPTSWSLGPGFNHFGMAGASICSSGNQDMSALGSWQWGRGRPQGRYILTRH